jgi:hypothetical protein
MVESAFADANVIEVIGEVCPQQVYSRYAAIMEKCPEAVAVSTVRSAAASIQRMIAQ